MVFRPLSFRPVRRLLAALATLCVLLTTLGWTRTACDTPLSHGSAGAAGHHVAPPAGDAKSKPCHPGTDSLPGDRPGHGGHDADGLAPCPFIAHCTTAVLAAMSVAPAARIQAAASPAALGETLPPGPADQPDSPPPRG